MTLPAAPRLALLHPAPLEWLLDPADPASRLRALKDVLDRADDAEEVLEARAALLESARIRGLFATQRPDGSFGDLAREDLPDGTAWAASYLLLRGVPARDPRLVSAVRALLRARQVIEGPGLRDLPAGAWSSSGDAGDVASCVTGDGLALSLSVLGPIEENRNAVIWLLRQQRHDGGWLHCHRWSWKAKAKRLLPAYKLAWPEETDPAVRSCRFGTYRALRALSTLPEDLRDDVVRRALTRGAEYFLARGVTGSLEKPDQDLEPHVKSFNPNFALLGTPVRQTLDMLAVARLLVDLGYAIDPRLARTLRRLREGQKPDGRWTCEATSEGMVASDEQPVGQPSKWITLDAISLLRRVARSTGRELDLGRG